MATDWTVVWSPRARETYFVVLDYLNENWSKRKLIQFVKRVDLTILVIRRNPELFAASRQQNKIRKAFVDKNNCFFYSIDAYKQQLIILTFYDNRQDPRKFKLV